MELNLLTITVQAVGTLLVAGLLWQLTHVVPGQFLRYWSAAWAALAVAVFALRLAVVRDLPDPARRAGLGLYLACEYLFAFLLWAGLRAYADGSKLRRADWLWLVPFGLFAVVAPVVAVQVSELFPFHAPLLALLFLAGARQAWRHAPRRPSIGLKSVRGLLLALGLLFLHYGPVLFGVVYLGWPMPVYLELSPVYDALIELGLAFGMVVMTVERVRDEMQSTNDDLAAATRKLAAAARTDALTGLLNRRAFDDLPATAGEAFAGTLAVLDVNDLKPLNDRHGHPAGDAALQTVARALRNAFRVTDPLFRIGGDEFVVVVEELGEVELVRRMQKVEAALAGVRLPGVPEMMTIRIAWGVSAFAATAEFAAALADADRSMYAAKEKMKGVGSVAR